MRLPHGRKRKRKKEVNVQVVTLFSSYLYIVREKNSLQVPIFGDLGHWGLEAAWDEVILRQLSFGEHEYLLAFHRRFRVHRRLQLRGFLTREPMVVWFQLMYTR